MNPIILPLSDPQATLEVVGGKGMSLAKLAEAGLPVPGGFHITTQAYRQFVSTNNLQDVIQEALQNVDASLPSTFEIASRTISARFADAAIPAELANAIVSAYHNLPGSNPSVAVRSSATAEDLPEASFAGQQETYLNISGADLVLEATQKCWASLWTARAIAYRLRQNIPSGNVALAVVVQLLVNAEAAGILFTANPLNGNRDEMVINASWGLGEAVVGGAVTPDTLTIRKLDGKLLRRETVEKLVMTVRLVSGTQEQPVPDALKKVPVLNDEQAAMLGSYGAHIEELYGAPMDIEWTLADGEFAILQARPITTLGEAPLEWKPPTPKGLYMRTSVVDLMPDPLSPLFISMGIPTLTAQMYPLGRMLTHSQPVLPPDYYTTINTYAYMNAKFPVRGWFWLIFGLIPAYPRLLRLSVPFWRDEALPNYRRVVASYQGKDFQKLSSSVLWQEIHNLMNAAAYYTSTLLFATMGASAGSEALLTKVYDKLAKRPGDPPATALLMGWDNIPSRAEKSLYDLALFCQERQSLALFVLETPSSELASGLGSDRTPQGVEPADWLDFQQHFERHLQDFGYLVFDLDFAKPLPRDHPEPMLEVIKMYLRGEGVNPYQRQETSQHKRIQTTQDVLGRLKGFRRWVFSKVLKWAQTLSEVREDALAEIGLGYPLLRQMFHELGQRLVHSGNLSEADDIFWLEKEEVEQSVVALEKNLPQQSKQAIIEQRKAFWHKARQATPPPMLPMRKKVMGMNTSLWLAESEDRQAGDTIKGVPASPGRVTAPARLLHGVKDFDQMRPGDVLVAGTTTPAWTPLFSMAAAVVTDIGGPLSHGSIVAREYGIPAVMGTGVATRRIRNGQIVTVDGNAGTVTLQ